MHRAVLAGQSMCEKDLASVDDMLGQPARAAPLIVDNMQVQQIRQRCASCQRATADHSALPAHRPAAGGSAAQCGTSLRRICAAPRGTSPLQGS